MTESQASRWQSARAWAVRAVWSFLCFGLGMVSTSIAQPWLSGVMEDRGLVKPSDVKIIEDIRLCSEIIGKSRRPTVRMFAQAGAMSDGSGCWTRPLTHELGPGEPIQVLIGYTNTTKHVARDVMVKFRFAKGLEPVAGSVVIMNSNYKEGLVATDQLFKGDYGANIGDYSPNGNAWIRFVVRMPARDGIDRCGATAWGMAVDAAPWKIPAVSRTDEWSLSLFTPCTELTTPP